MLTVHSLFGRFCASYVQPASEEMENARVKTEQTRRILSEGKLYSDEANKLLIQRATERTFDI